MYSWFFKWVTDLHVLFVCELHRRLICCKTRQSKLLQHWIATTRWTLQQSSSACTDYVGHQAVKYDIFIVIILFLHFFLFWCFICIFLSFLMAGVCCHVNLLLVSSQTIYWHSVMCHFDIIIKYIFILIQYHVSKSKFKFLFSYWHSWYSFR